MRPRTLARWAIPLAALAAAAPARAHPHVWVTAKAELVYAQDGRLEAVRHRWTFDPGYSAYVTQGLGKDGKPTPEELQDLAKTNVESLVDFEYFTHLKANGAKQAFEAPRDYGIAVENGQAILTYLLPLKAPAPPKTVALEVYDPTFFVAFTLDAGSDAVTLGNAPKGCVATVSRPKQIETAQQRNVSEEFFQALTNAASVAAQSANRIIVACP